MFGHFTARRVTIALPLVLLFTLLSTLPARADSVEGLTFSVAGPTMLSIGTRFQGLGVAEIGTVGSDEQVRGLIEFDIRGQRSGAAFLGFNFLRPTGESGQAFYNGDIDVLLYDGNNLANLSDFQTPAVFRATFNSVFASQGDVSLSLTDYYNGALARGATSLGVRFQPVTSPNNSAVQFHNFRLFTPQQTVPVPEPATALLLGTGLAGATLKLHKRRRAGKH